MSWPRLLPALLTALWLPLLVSGLALPAEAREQAAVPAAVVAEVLLEDLPVQARSTLVLIRQGGPFPYRKDGSTFGNRERLLPLKRHG